MEVEESGEDTVEQHPVHQFTDQHRMDAGLGKKDPLSSQTFQEALLAASFSMSKGDHCQRSLMS